MLPFRSVKNFYPRPPRGGRPPAVARGYPSAKISIHALREEGDVGGDPALGLFGISIHALREEGDRSRSGFQLCRGHFYPRPPRGGRRAQVYPVVLQRDFYPRPPRGGRPISLRCRPRASRFLSTPSARRATRLNFRASSIVGYFYPRPPRGGRRAVHRPLRGREDISIHALREEGDS